MTTKEINYTARIGNVEYSGSVTASNSAWNGRIGRSYAAADLKAELSAEEWGQLDVGTIKTDVQAADETDY